MGGALPAAAFGEQFEKLPLDVAADRPLRACRGPASACARPASFRRPGRGVRRGGAWRSASAACRNGSPACSSRAIVSPCEPIITGRKCRRPVGRIQPPVLLEFPHQEAKNAGNAPDNNSCQRATLQACRFHALRPADRRTAHRPRTAACGATVTTGKCLIGLICGSISTLTANRST